MTSLARVAGAMERMDEPGLPRPELEASLDHVAAVNRWLGGRRALLRHLTELWPPDEHVRILDVGSGSADLPIAIAGWARRQRRSVRILAADVNPDILAIAAERVAGHPEIAVERADATNLPHGAGAFDFALLSLTLHHFEGEQQVRALRELGRVARRAVLVGELQRAWPNYLGALALAATVWRRNSITRHDGPLSVLRAFTPAELLALARAAGLPGPSVHRHPFYRLVLRAGDEAASRDAGAGAAP